MAEYTPESRPDYLMRSCDAYVRTHVQTALGVTVYYEYQSVPSAINLPNQFVISTLVPLGPVQGMRHTHDDGVSQYTEAELVFNVMERSDITGTATVNRYTLNALVANIMNKFTPLSAIPVLDYATIGNPQAGVMRIDGQLRRIPVATPDPDALRQVNVIVPLTYHSVVTHVL